MGTWGREGWEEDAEVTGCSTEWSNLRKQRYTVEGHGVVGLPFPEPRGPKRASPDHGKESGPRTQGGSRMLMATVKGKWVGCRQTGGPEGGEEGGGVEGASRGCRGTHLPSRHCNPGTLKPWLHSITTDWAPQHPSQVDPISRHRLWVFPYSHHA